MNARTTLWMGMAVVGCSSPASKDIDSSTPSSHSGSEDTADTGEARNCAPPDENPSPTREGHPGDGWRWTSQGDLWPDSDTLDYGDGDLAPAIVAWGDGYRLVFTRKRGAERGLWTSESADGQLWSTPEPLQGLTAVSTEYPSLVSDGGVLRMWYGSGSVSYATSTDGVHFDEGDTAIRAGAEGSFDTLSLLYPHVVEISDDNLHLYYTGFDGASYAVGRVESTDNGVSWTSAELVLSLDSSSWDNTAVAMPMVRIAGTETLFWYGGYDTSVVNPGPWRIGFLRDGVRTVALPLSESGHDAYSTRDPAVLPWGDGYLMVYVGMGDDGVYRLRWATSDVCSEG